LNNIAGQENQYSDTGQLELVAHSVRLRDSDIECKPHIGASQRLQHFSQYVHSGFVTRQILIQGVTRMYLIFNACRSAILMNTPTIASSSMPVIPNRTGPHFSSNSGPPPWNADHGSLAGRR